MRNKCAAEQYQCALDYFLEVTDVSNLILIHARVTCANTFKYNSFKTISVDSLGTGQLWDHSRYVNRTELEVYDDRLVKSKSLSFYM